MSLTEIRLSKARKTDIARALDTKNRNTWHRNGLVKLVLLLLAISLSQYRVDLLSAAILFFSLLASQVVIFNPIVAKKIYKEQNLKYNFFHLSKSGWDGFWRRTIGEKTYYFLNLLIFVGGFIINYLNLI